MAMEMTQILLAAQSGDAGIRTGAEASLWELKTQHLDQFLLSLSDELAKDDKPVQSRRLAGILLKNSLDAKQWIATDCMIKSKIKHLLLTSLASPALEANRTSAQVIAKLASVEIPLKQWPQLVNTLLNNITHQATPAPLKQSTLETLGYICEELCHGDLVQDEVNSILTALVHGMNLNQSAQVRLAATKALLNALGFAKTNFENEKERTSIMWTVCQTTLSQEADIRQAAFECLVSVASMYYHVLGQYMDTLFQLSSNAISGDEDSVALQAIEFWSSICDEEIELQESIPHSGFIHKNLSSLVPLLLETLLKQEEDQDQDVWNISMAGGTCLGLVSRTVGVAIVPLVTCFVEAKISDPNWRSREAATYAFASILDGPTVVELAPLVSSALEFLLNATNDENTHVRDTTAWTLSRIFEFLHTPASGFSVVSQVNLARIVAVLLDAINNEPNVAEKICGAIYNLAHGYEDDVSSPLSPYLTRIIQHLLAAAERTDGEESNLRAAAYETLTEVVRCSNLAESSTIIAQLLPHVMKKLGQTMDIPNREQQAQLQASLCGVLQVIIQKLSGTGNMQNADEIRKLLQTVFECHSSSVHEEAMLAVGSFAYATGPEFVKHIPQLFEYLQLGLQNFKEYQVCSITAGVIGDICRALEDKILPYCDQIMTLLLQNLQSDALHRSVKPPIFCCFGDMALAIGAHFERYLTPALQMMEEAAHVCAQMDKSDEELMDYANQLRQSIFEAYSGILQGFKDAKAELLMPYAQYLLQFIEHVSKDDQRDESVMKAAVAAMGDLADALGHNTQHLFNNFTFYDQCLNECLQSEDKQLKETAVWTRGLIGQLVAPSSCIDFGF